MGKTKCMVRDATMVSTRETGKYLCSICHKGVGSKLIHCKGCKYWAHKGRL